MDDDTPRPDSTRPDSAQSADRSSTSGATPMTDAAVTAGGRSRWTVVLPAATLLVGVLLGGAVVGAATGDDDDADGPRARPAPTTPAAPTSDDDVVVRVPGPCVQLADRTEQAYALLDRGVAAARDLDARALADLVDEVQQRRPEVTALVSACRSQAADAVGQPAPTP